ncbi:hypothetical protein V8C86DRAFT_1777454, partial [Haematococcus lacustris]
CRHCGASMWPAERVSGSSLAHPEFGICCQKGRVGRLAPLLQPPEPLFGLLTDTSARGRQFRQRIRLYNCSLQLASSAIQVDRSIDSGVQQIVVNGTVHHRMGGLQPTAGQPPQFAQLYILDPAMQLQRRMGIFGRGTLDEQVLHDLQQMLMACNPYVQGCRTAMER